MKDEPIRTAIIVDLSDMHADIQATIRGKALHELTMLEYKLKVTKKWAALWKRAAKSCRAEKG